MATTTPNYGLRKPARTGGTSGFGDPVDAVADISDSMDTIDTEIKEVNDRIDTGQIRFFADTGTATSGSGAWVPVAFPTEVKDTANGHSTISNNSRYTAQVAGSYEVEGGVRFASNSSGSRGCRIAKNGVAIGSSDNLQPTTPSGQCGVSSKQVQVDLGVGDYVEVECWNNSGSNIAVDASSFSVKYLGSI